MAWLHAFSNTDVKKSLLCLWLVDYYARFSISNGNDLSHGVQNLAMGGNEYHLHQMLLVYRCFRISNKTFVSNLFRVGLVVYRSIYRRYD